MIEAREMIKYSENELALQRMRVAMESANGKAVELESMSVRSSATTTEEDKEALAALIMQNAMRGMRTKIMEGSDLDAEARVIRQAISVCRNLRVEIAPVQLAKLSLNDIGIEGGMSGVAPRQSKMGMSFMGGGAGGGDSIYAINKCALLKEQDDEGMKKTGSMKFKMLAKMAITSKKKNLVSGAGKANPPMKIVVTTLFSESRMQMTACLTKAMISSSGGELKGLEMFFFLKAIALEGKVDAFTSDVLSTDIAAQNVAANATNMAKNRDFAQMAMRIVQAARKERALANEVYLQLSKLMTDHETLSGCGGDSDMAANDARLRCWCLMVFFLRSVEVDPALLPFLDHHLQVLKNYEIKNGTGLASKMLGAMAKKKSTRNKNSLLLVAQGSFMSLGSDGPPSGSSRSANSISHDPTNTAILMKVSRYCHKCLVNQMRQEGNQTALQDVCREPKLKVAECLFEGKKINVRVTLMTGAQVNVPVNLIDVDSVQQFFGAMEMAINKSVFDITIEKNKMELQRRWNGFSLYSVDGFEGHANAFEVGDLPLLPTELERVAVDTDVCWQSTYDEFLNGKKVFVVRLRGNNKAEKFNNAFVPKVLNSDDYQKDVAAAKSLWKKWLVAGFKGVYGGLPSDDLKTRLTLVEEARKMKAGIYDKGSVVIDAASYLLAFQFALDCPKAEWVKGPTPTSVSQWLKANSGSRTVNAKLVEATVAELYAMEGSCAQDNKHFAYLLRRGWLAYARMWPLFGCTSFTGNLKQNKKVAMSQDVEIQVGCDGIMLFSKASPDTLLFSCRHSDIDECSSKGKQHVMFAFTGLSLEFEIYESGGGKSICSLMASLCSDIVWEGSFDHGCGQGSAENESGSLSQHDMMKNFLHEFPVLPNPPDPPRVERDISAFTFPDSDRHKWVEQAREAEQRAVEESRELSEKAAAREQDAMAQATMKMINIAEEDEEGGALAANPSPMRKRSSKAGALWRKATTAVSMVTAVSKRHQLNSTIFGVPGTAPSMNYMIPDPPPHRRRFGVVHAHSRICGGVMHPPVKPEVTKIGMPMDVLCKADLAFPTMSLRDARKIRANTQVVSKKDRASLSIDSTVSTFGAGGSRGSPDVGGLLPISRSSLVHMNRIESGDELASEPQDNIADLGGRTLTTRRRGSSTVGAGMAGTIARHRKSSLILTEGNLNLLGEAIKEEDAEGGRREEEEEERVEDWRYAKKAEEIAPPPQGLQSNTPSTTGQEKATDLWECRCDPNSNYAFYVSKITGQGAWTPPEGATPEELGEFTKQYQASYQQIVLQKWQYAQQVQAAQAAQAPTEAPAPVITAASSMWAGAITAQAQQTAQAAAGGAATQATTQWDSMTAEQKAYYTWYYKQQQAAAAQAGQ
jgi:hypothetical protein